MKIRTCNFCFFFPLIQSIYKIGLSISASFHYQLEPVATLHICPTPRTCGPALKTCADLYQKFPASHIDIFAWYQKRYVKWCKWGWAVSICIFMCLFVLLFNDCLVNLAFFCDVCILLACTCLFVTTPSINLSCVV